MNFNNDEEALDFFNRLLDRLHQAGQTNNGSKIEIVYVASGGQHVETQYISLTPNPSPKGEGNFKGRGVDTFKGERNLPEPLASEEAMALWEKVQKTGYVDDTFQPTISRTQAAILADEIAERLEIKEKWKAFETLWNRRNMYRDYHDALNQRQSLQFRDKLRELFR